MRYYTPSGRSIQAQGIQPDIVIKSPDGKEGGAVRERDLEGHLAEEGAPPDKPRDGATVVVPDKGAAPQPGEEPNGARDVPTDPVKGSDFTLSVGYQLLLKAMDSGSNRTAGAR
jgi:carboxyl-terminal processing protease